MHRLACFELAPRTIIVMTTPLIAVGLSWPPTTCLMPDSEQRSASRAWAAPPRDIGWGCGWRMHCTVTCFLGHCPVHIGTVGPEQAE